MNSDDPSRFSDSIDAFIAEQERILSQGGNLDGYTRVPNSPYPGFGSPPSYPQGDQLHQHILEPEPELSIPDSEVAPGEGWREIVVDSNGLPRQAGADLPEGKLVKDLKNLCEKHLFIYAKAILGFHFLSKPLHSEACEWLTRIPPYRKLLMLPRDHCKSTIVSESLPTHMLLQLPETNIYFPGRPGSDCRILLCCETEGRGKGWMRVNQTHLERNELLRAFWPHIVWENARREASKWNENEIIVPRDTTFPDPSIKIMGVGGAITGGRPNVLICDDLISFAAANSDTVMQTAIDWYTAAEALLDEYEEESGLSSITVCIGTHWAVWDLYTHIEENDPAVEILKRAILEPDPKTGKMKVLWPERFTMARIRYLEKKFGSMYPLLYMNQPFDPKLVDFDMTKIRSFNLTGNVIHFGQDDRDLASIEEVESAGIALTPEEEAQRIQVQSRKHRGKRLTRDNFNDILGRRDAYIRAKFS